MAGPPQELRRGEIVVTPAITIREDELIERFVRAQGPGGQHVNKTSSAVELRFDIRRSPGLPDDVKARLEALAGSRLTLDGVIVLFAQTRSSQQLNREEARERLLTLIRQAAIRPKRRRPTKPTFSSKLKRLEGKSIRSGVKAGRGRVRED
ncbi:alternative ribosome rescue aminoacyl-tRNA hydrolase ArfB [soil metagenome]